jgi:hypothetical protein
MRLSVRVRTGLSAILPTQAEAIDRAVEIDPKAEILVERVRNTSVGAEINGESLRNFVRSVYSRECA